MIESIAAVTCRCPHGAVARGRCLVGARLQADAAPCCRSAASVSRATSARAVVRWRRNTCRTRLVGTRTTSPPP
ncbi:hypothetical protein BXOR1_14825 [Xanthomonas oryzae pv. oryzicola]|nr:hypothetical protein FE36_01260 [Xanthomonas oryzae pv. oryzicola]KOR49375.1 hypothetical protein ADT27_04980 [Xanthomonas oryzae]AKO02239.1 hypothetical protein ACU15_18890 [Xanthomonas oryzae pv. oryzicola]AKO03102.1 hypothetical protein ACU16_01770 [Xanthomonas oryzae pv. oryzicola]AKO07018.1 hypothetical protein ACU17_01815 [Xanthomonas oryzae pv. oryzicola]